ncbi:MAG: ORF6N domain-containing protein [Prevotellaceae bacterium]|jgi:type VI protein secretion system component VasA|nr:ORF6N domain-containing protein [Prevotellaceae bacterium]
MDLIKQEDVNNKIVTIRNTNVILDSDVAALYGVQTKEINQAVKNNPDKFPLGYIFELGNQEITNLRSKFLTANISSKTRVAPKAFTEKGLYMLATILKSPLATQTTLAIIEAFTKMRAMSMSIIELMQDHENEQKQQTLVQKGEELFGEIIGNALDTVDTETSFELNLAAFKIKHTVKRSKNVNNNN